MTTIAGMSNTGTGNRRCLINMSELADGFTAKYSTALAAEEVPHCDKMSACMKGCRQSEAHKDRAEDPNVPGHPGTDRREFGH